LLRFSRFISTYLTAITLSLTFCHLLEMPRKMQYGEALYMSVQHSLYLSFGLVGVFAEVGAVVFLVALCIMLRKHGPTFYATLIATVCVGTGLAIWIAFVSPANTQMAQWSAVPLPANWTDVRKQWEFGHAVSAILDLIGFGALVISVLLDTPKTAAQQEIRAKNHSYDAA
jgi:hypothetical protein